MGHKDKTKPQSVDELEELRDKVAKLEYDLRERHKELDCIYGIANAPDKPDATLEEILQHIVDLLPPAWQYPEIACGRIAIEGKQEFRTANFRESPFKQASNIKVRGNHIGTVEVSYLEERPECDEGPFLREERSLIDAIAERLGKIIDRIEAEESLRRSEGKYRSIFENATEGISQTTPDGRYLNVNPELARMYGFDSPEEMIEKISDIGQERYVNPEDRERLKGLLAEHGKVEGFETRLYRKDGSTIWVSANIHVVRDSDGNILYYEGTNEDITERKKAEEALKESEKTLRAFFDAVHEGMLLTDREGTVILINEVSARRMGKAVTELVGTHLYDNLPRDLARYRKEHHEKVIATAGPVYFQDNWSGRSFEHHYYPVFDEQGNVSAIAIFARDVTERKRWLETLEESEERYRTVVEHSRDGIAIIGGGVHIYVNQRFLDMFGFESAQEVIGKTHSLMVHPDDLERVNGINRKRQNGEIVPSTYEFKGIRKHGTVLFIEVSATRVMYKGSYDSLVFLRDVTDRKRAEEALHSSEQALEAERDKLRRISENAPFGLVLIDNGGRFTYVNPKFLELFGFDPADVPDGRAWFLRAYPDVEYRHTVISTWIEDTQNPGLATPRLRVFTVTCKDGTQKVINFITSVLVSGDYLMACEDITELRRLESELRQAQKMEALGTLAGGIAHDFNNILTAIMGYASLLQMNMDRVDPLRTYVDPIISATGKAADLTRSLLSFSRRQPVSLAPLDINKAIAATKRLLERLLTEDVELRTSSTDKEAIVMADKTQMDQILFNLVTNARDAMPNGGTLGIETTMAVISSEFIRAHGFGEPGQYVVISVSDTGIGMDEETKEHIFDPFFTTKEVGKGTGLGLATVYGIVKQHGGYITVDSAPNRGSVFQVYLPATRATPREEERERASIRGGNERILIAEDNEDVRRFMRDLLQRYGYRIIEAVDGEDAIFKFGQNQDVDLVIVDSVMPKKNGREVYEKIRRIHPRIKTLFTSGYTKDIVLDKGIEDKDLDFIAKPLSPMMLLQRVREVLDR